MGISSCCFNIGNGRTWGHPQNYGHINKGENKMDINKILQGFKDIADSQTLLQEEAMVVMHDMNLQGLKRKHRHYSRMFHKHCVCIDNFAQDYGMKVSKPALKGGYKAKDLKDHFNKMIALLEKDLDALKKLNFAFIQACGKPYADGECMMKTLTKMWMKMKFRWMPRFEFTKWSPEDIVSWDKWLHDKIRCEELEHKYHEEH